jgi:hypothetical protein
MWDPRINPPISVSGQFIGDYQGLVADDKVAIPFWNDTQLANLPKSSKKYSPYQEVFAARIPNTAKKGGPGCKDRRPPRTSLPRKNVKVKNRRVSFHGKAKDRGCKGKKKGTTRKSGLGSVFVSIAKLVDHEKRCRFLKRDGTFTAKRDCGHRVFMKAKGRKRWHFSSNRKLPKGTYRITSSGRDRAGNREKPVFGKNTVKFRVR